jgi:hypothetical protein
VQVTSGQERRFRDEVISTQDGFGAYVPLRRVVVQTRRRWREVAQPVISSYVLVELPFCPTDRQLGLMSPLAHPRLLRRSDGAPARVRVADVNRLRAEELAGSLNVDPRQVSLYFWKGRILVVRQGILAGTQATVARTPRFGAERGEFLVNRQRVNMPLDLFFEGA